MHYQITYSDHPGNINY